MAARGGPAEEGQEGSSSVPTRATAASVRAPAAFSLFQSMAFCTPSAKAAAIAETAPLANNSFGIAAALAVVVTSDEGTAADTWRDATVARNPADNVTPRRASRERRRSLAVASRDK